jgi:sulfopropanediol 3-dehydrogenase
VFSRSINDIRKRGFYEDVFVILCDTQEEMVAEADRIASEHVQVMTRDPDYSLHG